MKIAAAIVTYNRLDFLKDLIEALRNQTKKPDYIFVTNNSSTDNTEDWLKNQDDIQFITQENVGSSGGQYTSFKQCLESDADYFWIMDDDVLPEQNCLEELAKKADKKRLSVPIRITSEGDIFLNEPISLNLSNPFSSIWKEIISNEYLAKFEHFVPADGLTFEGPFFHRSLAEKVGLPEFNFFIHADDTEYMIRAKGAGFELGINKKAKLKRRLVAADPRKEFTWKHYYIIRNIIALDILHGNWFVRTLRPYFYYYRWLKRARTIKEKETVTKAFRDGLNYKKQYIND